MGAFNFDIGVDKIRTKKFWRAVAAEFVGMILFLMCVTTVALRWTLTDAAANNVEIGIGIGLAIASLAQAFGHVSGGHLNPAVTLGMIVGKRINILQGLFYIVAQTIGGVAGTGLTYAFTPANKRKELGVTSLHKDLSVEQGFAIELLFTFLLVFVVFSITDSKKNTEPYGTTLGIGVTILVCHVCIIPYTGCGINPARSFGPALVMNLWVNHWIYWIAPMLGGVLAALAYNLVFYVDEETYEIAKESENHEMVKNVTEKA